MRVGFPPSISSRGFPPAHDRDRGPCASAELGWRRPGELDRRPTAATAPTLRDRHLQCIAERGRAAWQKASGYNSRARVEATMGRFKQVIGDGLRCCTDQRRAIEVEVAVHALNRMLELGRPESVRIG